MPTESPVPSSRHEVTSATPQRIGVTGASGYLGGSLVDHVRSLGHEVVSYRRTRGVTSDGHDVRELDLATAPDPGTFEGVTTLVHAAWDLRDTDAQRSWERNVEGSKRIVAAAIDDGVRRIIFVSSMSAYFGTRQDYGLMKLSVERTVLESGHVVVRPGLVYGGAVGGMTLTLSKLATLPLIPVFRGAKLFTAHVDDVIASMTTLSLADDVPATVVGLANPTSVSFRTIMTSIARTVGASTTTMPIPWRPLLMALRTAERVGVALPVRSDSLLGLVRSAPTVPGVDVARRFGLEFRPFPEGLEDSILAH